MEVMSTCELLQIEVLYDSKCKIKNLSETTYFRQWFSVNKSLQTLDYTLGNSVDSKWVTKDHCNISVRKKIFFQLALIPKILENLQVTYTVVSLGKKEYNTNLMSKGCHSFPQFSEEYCLSTLKISYPSHITGKFA